MSHTESNYYSGTSGLVVPFAKLQYPKEFQSASRLEYYSSLFNSLEVNSSFYKTPMPATVAKWSGMVPDHFKFSFKLSKNITHVKDLVFNKNEASSFMQTINQCDKRGCLLIQFPAGLKADKLHSLEELFGIIIKSDKNCTWKIAVEFRDSSWYNENVYKLLKKFGAGLVLHDIAASAPPVGFISSAFAYYRFHGAGKLYGGSYSDELLRTYSEDIKSLIANGKIVYCYFNNTMGDAYNNLRTLNELVQLDG